MHAGEMTREGHVAYRHCHWRHSQWLSPFPLTTPAWTEAAGLIDEFGGSKVQGAQGLQPLREGVVIAAGRTGSKIAIEVGGIGSSYI